MNKKQQAIFDKMNDDSYSVIKCSSMEEVEKVTDVFEIAHTGGEGWNLWACCPDEGPIISLRNDSFVKILCTGAEFLAMKDDDEEEDIEPNVEEIRFVTNLFENSFNEFKKQLNKPKVLEDAEQLVNQFDLIVNVLKEKATSLNAGQLKKLIKKLEGVLHEK